MSDIPSLSDFGPGDLLFHYTTRDAALGGILTSGVLHFSSFEDMRDPLEYKEWMFAASGFIGDKSGDEIDRQYFAFNHRANAVKRRARLLALSTDGPENSPESGTSARGWGRSSMWEHYAEAHRGVCLAFDKAQLIENVTRSLLAQGLPTPYHKPVKYEVDFRDDPVIDLPVQVPDLDSFSDAVFEFIEKNNEPLFFRKASDWSNEFEYRFVVTAPDGFEDRVVADVGDAAVALIVGERFPDWGVPGALELCRSFGMDARKLAWAAHDAFPARLKP